MDELQFAASQGECEALCDQVIHSIRLYATTFTFRFIALCAYSFCYMFWLPV